MIIGIDGNEANTTQRVGSNVYAFELISALEELDKENEYLIYLREKKRQELPQIKKNFSYRVIPPRFLWTQWRLPIDLYMHEPRPQVFFTPGHYAPRFSPMPSVISLLDLSFLKYPQSFKPAVRRQLTNWTRRSAKNSAHILTISQATKRDIISHYSIDPRRVTVTYPGVSQRFKHQISKKDLTSVRKKYAISGEYLLFVGTRQPKKNLPRLTQAFSQLKSSLPNLSLVIVGKTWKQFASEAHPKTNQGVIEPGYVPGDDLPALMQGAAAFALPSLYEGFGIPVAEAMTVGTPVVVSNAGSLPEIVGDAGILVNPKSVSSITQGIKKVLGLSREKRVQLINKGKKQAKKFTWKKCAQQTLEILHEVAA